MKNLNELIWIEELLPFDVVRKAMFGGYAYYSQRKMILVVFEGEGKKSYRGQNFAFELWNGCMFPVEKDLHGMALEKYPFLIPHPVLPKWLYLPLQSEDFEERVSSIIKDVKSPHSIWGVVPKDKKKKNKKTVETRKVKTKVTEVVDCRFPRMFSESETAIDLEKFDNISDLKNLGPASESEFLKAGIKTPKQFKKMGWKKALAKLVEVNPKNAHAIFAYALIGALNNKEWFRLSPEEKNEAQVFVKTFRKK